LRGGYFDKISGITSEIESVKNWVTSVDNDPAYEEQIPGRRMSGDITLTGTVDENQGFWQWHMDISEGKDRRTNCSIVAFDENFNEVARWDVEGAWPRQITITEMDAGSSGLLQQEIILAHSGFTRVAPASP
jgi:phage tail-like protein